MLRIRRPQLSLATTALLISVIPFLSVHVAWLVSLYQELIPACNPYLSGCVTISRAARSSEAIYLFKVLMILTSPLMVWYWLKTFNWLERAAGQVMRGAKAMRFFGIVGAVFLILYVVFLGTEGDFYRWMRRYGVTIYFSFTALAQIFFIQQLFALRSRNGQFNGEYYIYAKTVCCVLQWLIGLVSLPLEMIYTGESKDIINNVVEWNFALAMNTFFFISFLMYRRQSEKSKLSRQHGA